MIAVDELTLRSTQLASSTFDFFSIFFASGLMYLVLTGAIAMIQLIAEASLDLDRPASGRFARLLPWRRAGVAVGAGGVGNVAAAVAGSSGSSGSSTDALAEPEAPLAARPRLDRAKRYAELAKQEAAVRVTGLHKRYGEQTVLDRFDLTVRTGEVFALLRPSGSGKSTLLRCINHLEQ